MYNDIEEKRLHMKRRYFQSSKHTVQVDFVPYMDELAGLIGCKPPLQKVGFCKTHIQKDVSSMPPKNFLIPPPKLITPSIIDIFKN